MSSSTVGKSESVNVGSVVGSSGVAWGCSWVGGVKYRVAVSLSDSGVLAPESSFVTAGVDSKPAVVVLMGLSASIALWADTSPVV